MNVPYNAKGGYGPYLKMKQEEEEAKRRKMDEGEADEGAVEKKGLLAKDPYGEEEEEEEISYVSKEDDE